MTIRSSLPLQAKWWFGFGCLMLSSFQLKADIALQLYGGRGFTGKHNADVNLPEAGIHATHERLSFDSATTVGGRITYWTKFFPYFGIGIDGAHFFGPDQRQQASTTRLCVAGFGCSTSPELLKPFHNSVTMFGVDGMLRFPLFSSEQFNQGQLQPYLTVGPAMFQTTLTDTENFIPSGQSSLYTSLGVKAGAGFLLFITKHMGLFMEYRDTHFQVKDKYYNATVAHGITLGKTLGSATFNIQSVVGGVSFYF